MICFLVGLGSVVGVVFVLWLLGVLASRLVDGQWDYDAEMIMVGLLVVVCGIVTGMVVNLLYLAGCGILGRKP